MGSRDMEIWEMGMAAQMGEIFPGAGRGARGWLWGEGSWEGLLALMLFVFSFFCSGFLWRGRDVCLAFLWRLQNVFVSYMSVI